MKEQIVDIIATLLMYMTFVAAYTLLCSITMFHLTSSMAMGLCLPMSIVLAMASTVWFIRLMDNL